MPYNPHLPSADTVNHQALTPLSFLDIALEKYAKRPAVAWRDYQWDYAEFSDIVSRIIVWLRSSGIGSGDVVSVILSNRPELLAVHYAVPALGAVLNTINSRLNAEDVDHLLIHAGSKLLISEQDLLPNTNRADVPSVIVCKTPDDNDGLNFFKGSTPKLEPTALAADETQAIALNYTSGTTGKPKGVVYTHRGAYLNAIGNVMLLRLSSDSRYLWTLPMFHCNGWMHTWAVTAAGGLHVCLDRVEPQLILNAIDHHRITHMCCAPTVLYMLANEAKVPLEHKVKVGTGGAAPTPDLLSKLEHLGFNLLHLYGLTESYGPATANLLENDPPDNIEQKARLLARQGHGHLTGVTVRVVDNKGLDVPADGVSIGEIVLRGNTLMAGYFRDPEATKAAFAGGFFHTGDLAIKHPNGEIEIRDRSKDIIISGGENFASIEVEAILYQHPEVLLAAVVAVPHLKWGEAACAFIQPREQDNLDTKTLATYCREHLSGFKRPRYFVFGEVPVTATGKVQKYILRERAKKMMDAGELNDEMDSSPYAN